MVIADWIALALVALGTLRGVAIGLTREVFSLAALAGAALAVMAFGAAAGAWIESTSGLDPLVARVAGSFAVGAGVIAVVAVAGRLVRRGLRAAGLAFWDRLAGGVLGAAEGTLAAALLLVGALALVGPEHPALAGSRSLAAFEQLAARLAPASPEHASPRHRAAFGPGAQAGSTQRPWLRISSTSRASATAAGTWRSTHSRPT